jgi:hypothetical protein
VNTGLFGSHETFIPLANAQLNSGGLVVPYAKSFIKDAPNIGPDGELSVEQENELFHYYGIDNPNALRGNAGAPGADAQPGERDARGANASGADARQDARDAGAAGDRAALEQEIQRGDGRAAEAGVGVAGAAAAAGAHPTTGAERIDPNAGGRHAATGAGVASAANSGTASDPDTAVGGAATQGGAPQASANANLRLRKRVVTETKLVEVPVQREEIVVENPDGTVRPVDGAAGGTPAR